MSIQKLSPQIRELLSALADGELMPEEFPVVLRACDQDPTAPGNWNTYHVIGELLRAPGSTVRLNDSAFMGRLNQRLAKEPSLVAVPHVAVPHAGVGAVHGSAIIDGESRGAASNDGSFRWKVVAGVACAAAVSALAWNVNGLMVPAAGPQLAQSGTWVEGASSQQVVVASPQGLMVRDARLEELVAAHKQLGATSALPVPSGFLRNANFETQQSLGR